MRCYLNLFYTVPLYKCGASAISVMCVYIYVYIIYTRTGCRKLPFVNDTKVQCHPYIKSEFSFDIKVQTVSLHITAEFGQTFSEFCHN